MGGSLSKACCIPSWSPHKQVGEDKRLIRRSISASSPNSSIQSERYKQRQKRETRNGTVMEKQRNVCNRAAMMEKYKTPMGIGQSNNSKKNGAQQDRSSIPGAASSGKQNQDNKSSKNIAKRLKLEGSDDSADIVDVRQEHNVGMDVAGLDATVNKDEGSADEMLVEKQSDDEQAPDPVLDLQMTNKDQHMATEELAASKDDKTHLSSNYSKKCQENPEEYNMINSLQNKEEVLPDKDSDEDLYRDEEEIKKENLVAVLNDVEQKMSVLPEVDILTYCVKEWKGGTPKAELMKKAYAAVSQTFSCIRRVRGDNYCALRATLFQALSQLTHLPSWLQSKDLDKIPEKLIAEYDWINQWRFGQDVKMENESPSEIMKACLQHLKEKWTYLHSLEDPHEKVVACENIFQGEQEEYFLYEAVKLLMLKKAIELYCEKEDGNDVPIFCWLLFAREESDSPYRFMKNSLNQVGYTGGLEQVEMFLLGYALELTIAVYRLSDFGTDEFLTFYPDDHKDIWPVVILTAEDDRHYNVLVRKKESAINVKDVMNKIPETS
ncbi:ubiquitin thioesterase otulin-like isoform X2 [Protopterus annectens]|uniref:ubiquitin thioesterase otulin-like isoform X2 n=1 Tax=Protopterus annectens TaxID=7888 RepID=UPI001CF94921|nr:ubiquitin thioesterase otulin-like isoform X2 [Protopterus annectens]XP_043921148.1 ubiquitin thioesterase otulin-like isoform X2 [Protopterus annectens]